jgi:flagellar biosynthesis/type III secretory pathway ATPase
MSRERELLQRVLDGDANRHWTISSRLYKKIEAVLAEPEQKPLTREKISYGFRINVDAINAESFWAGVEYAENMHGITGVDDE